MLTGTPLQNDLEELQNLLRFLMPKLFTAEEAEEIATVQVGLTYHHCTSVQTFLYFPGDVWSPLTRGFVPCLARAAWGFAIEHFEVAFAVMDISYMARCLMNVTLTSLRADTSILS